MYFVGIDVSTTASKALAIDENGDVVVSASYAHPISTPQPLWSEQNPLDWWDATSHALRDITAKLPAEQIVAVGLTGQMHGLTTLDKDNNPVRPAILWNDQRSGAECAAITEKVGAKWLYGHIGSLMLPGFTAPKLAWLRDHEPEAYARIAKFLLPKDYIRFRLSGAYVTDVADGSGIALMDIARRTWSDDMMKAFGFPREWLPELCESPEVCAHVNAEGAAATGLKVGTPIVGGAGDQPAGAIGTGITQAGETSLTVGTSGVVFTAADRYAPEPDGRLHTFCHAIPGVWFYMGVMLSAAGSLRWFHDEIAPDKSYDQLSDLAGRVPRGAGGLLFAPYLTGERHPHPDPLARGAFVGLTARHGLGHLVRAVMEGVSFGMVDNLALLRAQGTTPTSAAVSGGAANSAVWRAILAEIAGLPLYTVNSNEGAALGAAILGAVGVGRWTDVPSACAALIRKVDEAVPDPAGIVTYAHLREIFDRVYPTIQTMSHDIGIFDIGEG
jgi:xylulokinase